MSRQPPVFSGPSGRKPGRRTTFNRRSGEYVRGDDPLGEFNDSLMYAVMPPEGDVLDDSTTVHMAARNRWSQATHDDWHRILDGKSEAITSKFIRVICERYGVNPDHPERIPEGKRIKLCNALTREIRKLEQERDEHMSRRVDIEARQNAPWRGRRVSSQDASAQARNDLHQRLRAWAEGPLAVERPQGSSLHHLIEYDATQTDGDFARHFDDNDWQIVVVENDWGAAVPPMDGHWRVPFEQTCWEFRISGVRVLAFTDAGQDVNSPVMWLVYGRDGHWVIDDYQYVIGDGGLRGEPIPPAIRDPVEFRRVVQRVHDCIRSSCIMIDAEVARHEHVSASVKLSERRLREGKSPLRDHYVVRLLHLERRAHVARSAGAGTGGPRAPQRGHWRRGTYVHFDDQDSGEEQYVNDGGFVVSRTWRRWHFAGDPRNIIHREYRL